MRSQEPNHAASPDARSIILTAVGPGRTLDLRDPGAVTVLICFAQSTQDGIEVPENAVRKRWPAANDVLIAHVIDLTRVPSLFRSIAEGVLKNEHRRAVEALPESQSGSPDDYVIMLPDWSGEVAKGFPIPDPNVAMSCVVLTKNGRVVSSSNGADQGYAEVLAGVENALRAASDI